MLGEIVEHKRFGKGTVTAFDPPRMEVCFDSEPGAVRRFSYPAVTASFIRFVNPEAAERAARDLSHTDALARRDALLKIEANRRREEQIAESRMEALRKKRSDAAKKAAERRKLALASKNNK